MRYDMVYSFINVYMLKALVIGCHFHKKGQFQNIFSYACLIFVEIIMKLTCFHMNE